MSSRVIAIDGPAASGKSSTARAVAEALGFAHLTPAHATAESPSSR